MALFLGAGCVPVHSGVGFDEGDIVRLLTPFRAAQIQRMPRYDGLVHAISTASFQNAT